MSVQAEYVDYVVIGVGINVNQKHFRKNWKIRLPLLRIQAGKKFRRAEIAAAVLEEFEKNYETFLKNL